MAKIETYEIETVKRSEIKTASYNPRYISDEAKKRLKKGLKQFGLAQPLTVNKTTMTLISGHQRLSIIDEMEGYPDKDYDLQVAMVALSPEQERALNIQMNNMSMMGEFDFDALIEMVQRDGVDIDDLGFSDADLDLIFSDTPALESLLSDSEDVEEAKGTLDDIKKDRSKMMERQKDENSADYYFIVVCDSAEEKEALYKKMNVPLYEEYVASYHLERLWS